MSSTYIIKNGSYFQEKEIKRSISREWSVVSKWCQVTQRSLDCTEWELKMQTFLLECDTFVPEQLLTLQISTLKLIELMGKKKLSFGQST